MQTLMPSYLSIEKGEKQLLQIKEGVNNNIGPQSYRLGAIEIRLRLYSGP